VSIGACLHATAGELFVRKGEKITALGACESVVSRGGRRQARGHRGK